MKEILKQLECLNAMGHSSYSIFDDWLDLMLFALMRDDENYLKIVNKYNNDREEGKRPIDYFKNAFILLMSTMKETNDEVLGEIYMNWNISNKYSGQFFTPKHIAKFMAQLTKPSGLINDPTCGSGIMLVESCKVMTFEEIDEALFVGQDIDNTCFKMTALNMLFFNLNALIIWGDTLKMEYYKAFQTKRTYMGGEIRALSDTELEAIEPRIQKISESPKEAQERIKQLSLFAG
jgi:type I restriction-modification system DNA methylase subunit